MEISSMISNFTFLNLNLISAKPFSRKAVSLASCVRSTQVFVGALEKCTLNRNAQSREKAKRFSYEHLTSVVMHRQREERVQRGSTDEDRRNPGRRSHQEVRTGA